MEDAQAALMDNVDRDDSSRVDRIRFLLAQTMAAWGQTLMKWLECVTGPFEDSHNDCTTSEDVINARKSQINTCQDQVLVEENENDEDENAQDGETNGNTGTSDNETDANAMIHDEMKEETTKEMMKSEGNKTKDYNKNDNGEDITIRNDKETETDASDGDDYDDTDSDKSKCETGAASKRNTKGEMVALFAEKVLKQQLKEHMIESEKRFMEILDNWEEVFMRKLHDNLLEGLNVSAANIGKKLKRVERALRKDRKESREEKVFLAKTLSAAIASTELYRSLLHDSDNFLQD